MGVKQNASLPFHLEKKRWSLLKLAVSWLYFGLAPADYPNQNCAKAEFCNVGLESCNLLPVDRASL
jgi:hypothetical protein